MNDLIAKYYAKRDFLLDEITDCNNVTRRLIALKQIDIIKEVIQDLESLKEINHG